MGTRQKNKTSKIFCGLHHIPFENTILSQENSPSLLVLMNAKCTRFLCYRGEPALLLDNSNANLWVTFISENRFSLLRREYHWKRKVCKIHDVTQIWNIKSVLYSHYRNGKEKNDTLEGDKCCILGWLKVEGGKRNNLKWMFWTRKILLFLFSLMTQLKIVKENLIWIFSSSPKQLFYFIFQMALQRNIEENIYIWNYY